MVSNASRLAMGFNPEVVPLFVGGKGLVNILNVCNQNVSRDSCYYLNSLIQCKSTTRLAFLMHHKFGSHKVIRLHFVILSAVVTTIL